MFTTLSTELLELIFAFVEPRDGLLATRLVCQRFYAASFRSFAKKYFSLVESTLSVDSIQRLQKIGDHEIIRKQVKKLRIVRNPNDKNPETYDQGTWRFGRGGHYERISEHGLLKDHQTITSTLIDLLQSKLIRCRDIEITDCVPYPFPSSSGLSDQFLSSMDIIQLFLSVIAEGDIPIHALRIDFSRQALSLDPDLINFDILKKANFWKSWSTHVHELGLRFKPPRRNYGSFATTMIMNAANLQHLSLDFLRDHCISVQDIFAEIPEDMELVPRLKTLRLKSMRYIPQYTLLGIIMRFKNVVRISLETVILIRGGWSDVFRSLQGHFPRLEHLRLRCLYQCSPTVPDSQPRRDRCAIPLKFCLVCRARDLIQEGSKFRRQRAVTPTSTRIADIRCPSYKMNSGLENLSQISYACDTSLPDEDKRHPCQKFSTPLTSSSFSSLEITPLSL